MLENQIAYTKLDIPRPHTTPITPYFEDNKNVKTDARDPLVIIGAIYKTGLLASNPKPETICPK